jgi:excisionase family DNA binding protein
MQEIALPIETRPLTEEEEAALGLPAKYGMLDLDVYSVEDLAERLDLTTVTIKTHIKERRLPAVKFGGATGYRILRQDIYTWLISMRVDLIQKDSPAGRGRENISNGTE